MDVSTEQLCSYWMTKTADVRVGLQFRYICRSAAGLRVSFVCSAGSCSTPAGPLMELDGRGKRQRSDSPEPDPVSAVPATLLQHNASSNPSYKEAHLLRALALFLCQFRHLLRRIWSLHLSRRGRRPAQRGASSSMKTANAGSRFEVLATEDSMETGHPSNAQAKFTANNTFDFTLGSATHTKTPSQAGRRAAPTKKLSSSSSASPMKSKNTQSSSGPRPQQGPRIQTNAVEGPAMEVVLRNAAVCHMEKPLYSGLSRDGSASIGGILRDHSGSWIFGFKQKLSAMSTFAAELTSLYVGLQLLHSRAYQEVQIETYALQVVNQLLASPPGCSLSRTAS